MASFSIRYRIVEISAKASVRQMINPGLTKMLTVNPKNPVYQQADIDEYHESAYEFFDKYWDVDARPRQPADNINNIWFINDKQSGEVNWVCAELASMTEYGAIVDLDIHHGTGAVGWHMNAFVIVCTAVVTIRRNTERKIPKIHRGESIWYGFVDYFDPNEDMSVDFNPNTRRGPYWEHWPIWSDKPSCTYLNERGAGLREFSSRTWSPITPKHPNGLLCNHIGRSFLSDEEEDKYNEQDNSVYCTEDSVPEIKTKRGVNKFPVVL